jgi:hypothetical protein
MADEQKYNVVFTGRLAPHIDRATVLQNLADLYKTDAENVAQLFSNAGTIIKNNLNLPTAEQYVSALSKAGALCQTVAIPESKPQPYLEYQLGIGELRYSPLPINRINRGEGGININRVDKKDVLFQDIILLSVYEHPDVIDSKMLLFFRDCNQPFVCDCFKIAYNDFLDVKGGTMQDSIRNFAAFLLSNNPHLLFDKKTYEFIRNGKLPEFNGDIVRLTTALSVALAQVHIDSRNVKTTPELPAKVNQQKYSEPEPPIPAEQDLPAEKQTDQGQFVCPKCGQNHARDQLECLQCGVVFAKWHKKKEQERLSNAEPAESDYEWELGELDLWMQRRLKLFAYLLIGGFVLPLFKHSIMFDSSVPVWPWNIMGLGINAQKAAAMATVSFPEHMLIWALLPIVAAITLLSGRQFIPLRGLSLAIFLVGGVSLILSLIVFHEEAEILGLMFTPPTVGAGVMILLAVAGGILVASANHLRKRFVELISIRILSGIGGGLLVALMGLQLFASDGGWASWSMRLLYLLMIGYGVLGLLGAFRPKPEHAFLQRTSLVARAVLCWAPVACLIAQNWLSNPYTDFVTTGGGGFINIFISVAKSFLIYYGFSFLAAIGFTAYLEQSLLKKEALEPAA